MKWTLPAATALAAVALPLSAQVPAVPYTVITITGTQANRSSPTTGTYRAYQAAGETYRVLCQEPCAVTESLIFAVYQGFKPAKQQLVQLAGIDSLAALQPFDIHISGDSWCGPYSQGISGDAGTYVVGGQVKGSFGCFWNVEKALSQPPPFLPTPFTEAEELKIERQLLRVHEYGHTLFYNRHFYSYEDLVKAFSFYISSYDGKFVTDPCDASLANFSTGRLVHELCTVAGFKWSDLAPALQEIDRLYQQGLGEVPNWSPPVTSSSQLRRALDARIGKPTRDAFLSAGLLPHQAGDEGTWGSAAGTLDLGGGSLRLRFPAQALAGSTSFTLGQLYTGLPGQARFDFDLAFLLAPASAPFARPVPMTFRYDPTMVDPASSESSMKLFRGVSGAWQEVAGSFLDAADGTVTAAVPGGGTYALIPTAAADPSAPTLVVPTAASTAGAYGSFFRTTVRLHNPRDYPIAGKLVFRRAGTPGSAADPSVTYSLAFHETKVIADFLPAVGASGAGSIDLFTTTGPAPVVDTRVFNDGGGAGTTGVTEAPVRAAAALHAGDRGVLLVPPSLASQRLNVGVRTLGNGASLSVTARSAAGAVVKQVVSSYPATSYEQKSLADFLGGAALSGNESLEIQVTAGAAIVYGATGDNVTNDPSLQVARAIPPPLATGDPLTLPTVVSAPGRFDSFYRTALQLHNPETTTIAGKIVFHPAGAPGSAQDPSLSYSLTPGQTRTIDDLLPAMGQSGSGSADVVPSSGPAPVVVARVFNDAGSAGTTGLTEEALSSFAALLPGDHGVLLAPSDPANERMNVGVRTLGSGALVTVTVRGANGFAKGSPLQKSYPANYYEQKTLAEFIAPVTSAANDSIDVRVSSGGLFVYGATADNRTNDPSLQVPRRQASF